MDTYSMKKVIKKSEAEVEEINCSTELYKELNPQIEIALRHNIRPEVVFKSVIMHYLRECPALEFPEIDQIDINSDIDNFASCLLNIFPASIKTTKHYFLELDIDYSEDEYEDERRGFVIRFESFKKKLRSSEMDDLDLDIVSEEIFYSETIRKLYRLYEKSMDWKRCFPPHAKAFDLWSEVKAMHRYFIDKQDFILRIVIYTYVIIMAHEAIKKIKKEKQNQHFASLNFSVGYYEYDDDWSIFYLYKYDFNKITKEKAVLIKGKNTSAKKNKMQQIVQKSEKIYDKCSQKEKENVDDKMVTMFIKFLYKIGKEEGFMSKEGKHKRKAQEIGEMLNEMGGLALMQEVAHKVILSLQQIDGLYVGRELEHCWNGIGDWIA